MADAFSVIISCSSLVISATTAWFTLFKRGRVQMTQPTVVFFGPDSPPGPDAPLKIFLRTLLYSTSKRGHIVQSMYLKVRRGESTQVFNIWAYGEDKLSRGSGVFVGPEGLACNHHFLIPKDGTQFSFQSGSYSIEVYASVIGQKSPVRLWQLHLNLSEEEAKAIREKHSGIYFDWGPESNGYHSHIDECPEKYSQLAQKIFEQLAPPKE